MLRLHAVALAVGSASTGAVKSTNRFAPFRAGDW